MTDVSWITPHVAVGSAPSASDVPALVRMGVTDVLDLRGEPNAGEAGPYGAQYYGTPINYHYVPMRDNGSTEPTSVYRDGTQVIIDALAANPNAKVLIHCAAGQYRSPSMAYAYLRLTGMSPADAWDAVMAARPQAHTQYRADAERAVQSILASGGITPDSTTGKTFGVSTSAATTFLALFAAFGAAYLIVNRKQFLRRPIHRPIPQRYARR